MTAIRDMLSSDYSWITTLAEFTDLLDERPRLPYTTTSISMTAPSPSLHNMPPEVAICLSLEGTKGSGVNIRRRRGRVYLGPLQMLAGDNPAIPSANMNTIYAAFSPLMAKTEYDLCVYSRSTHYGVPVGGDINAKDNAGEPIYTEQPEALPASFNKITKMWIDNAWDTQRRRGLRATTRVAS